MRYSGYLGLSQETETSPGIWEDVVTERPIRGTVEQRTEVLDSASSVLPKYRTNTSISVLSRGLLHPENSDLRYVTYLGKKWSISSVNYDFPKVTLFLGEEYRGPDPD